MTGLYAGCALLAFLVTAWLVRSGFARGDAEVSRPWRLSGWLVWASLFLGGLSGVSSMARPLLQSLAPVPQAVVGGVLLGVVVGLVVRVGAGLAFRAETGVWRWALLFQVVALAGVLLVIAPVVPAAAVVAVVPLCGIVALALAFRDPPRPATPVPPAKPRRR
jgi:hypothetical protein